MNNANKFYYYYCILLPLFQYLCDVIFTYTVLLINMHAIIYNNYSLCSFECLLEAEL